MASKKSPSSKDQSVTLKWPGEEKTLRYPRGLQELQSRCLLWSYLVLRRSRWNTSRDRLSELGARAAEFLEKLGVKPDVLQTIADAGVVEVRIPHYDEGTNWWWRILPWEFLISSATRGLRSGRLTVVRHLDRRNGRPPKLAPAPGKAGVLISQPGKIAKEFIFENERELIRSCLTGFSSVPIETPTLAELVKAMRENEPAVVHLGGVDSHQGQTLLKATIPNFRKERPLRDGVVLCDEKKVPVPVTHEDFAKALVGTPRQKPRLVVLNVYRSAARTAALCVAEGAELAIGFQDTFDDLASEIFLAQFYRSWAAKQDALLAFELAWDSLSDFPSPLEGSGIVVWSASSLVPANLAKFQGLVHEERAALEQKRDKLLQVSAEQAHAGLRVRMRPLEEINYSLLHNREPLFERFEIGNPDSLKTPNVRVVVELQAGPEPQKCDVSLPVSQYPQSIQDQVFLPLTSPLLRSLREKMRALLSVKVEVENKVLLEETHRVTLLPVNEWVDSDAQRQWLPSFIYPMDAAVMKVIQKAQRHLRALSDSWSVGFDGYQSVDEREDDPTAPVDEQVAAIWNALVQDFTVGYINPPPTYTASSQRLRTPSQVIDGERGTCIDLALLLASCWEYVGIYPVIFLLSGHAFPGYWRSEDARQRFIDMDDVEGIADECAANEDTIRFEKLMDDLDDFPERQSWMYGRADQDRILAAVKSGDLVPVESTWLATSGVLNDAMDEGWANLRPRKEFEWLIDVTSAREADVTPLPLAGGNS